MTIRKLNRILRHLTEEGFNEAYIKFDTTGILSIEPVNSVIEVIDEIKHNKLTPEIKANIEKGADLFVKNVGPILKKLSKQ
jgi:uncharacterized protein (UPF0333 family)